MAGIKNRGSQIHRVKTKFRRKKYNFRIDYFRRNRIFSEKF